MILVVPSQYKDLSYILADAAFPFYGITSSICICSIKHVFILIKRIFF
jgi:hypothetical protein